MPTISAHNLVVGQMYLDLGETKTITNLKRPNEICEIKFERRGWLSKESFKFEGETFAKLGKKKDVFHKITGNWNKQASIVDVKTKTTEVIWQKTPYPENAAYMYGMSHYHV